jgi:hypothetical protein
MVARLTNACRTVARNRIVEGRGQREEGRGQKRRRAHGESGGWHCVFGWHWRLARQCFRATGEHWQTSCQCHARPLGGRGSRRAVFSTATASAKNGSAGASPSRRASSLPPPALFPQRIGQQSAAHVTGCGLRRYSSTKSASAATNAGCVPTVAARTMLILSSWLLSRASQSRS